MEFVRKLRIGKNLKNRLIYTKYQGLCRIIGRFRGRRLATGAALRAFLKAAVFRKAFVSPKKPPDPRDGKGGCDGFGPWLWI
jgi:hypothetical protein